MALRIDTTAANAESASWSPSGDMVFQVVAGHKSPAKVLVYGRCDAAAPWVVLYNWIVRDVPFQRIAKVPFVKVAIADNVAGEAVKVWDAE